MHIDNYLATITLNSITDNMLLKDKNILEVGAGNGSLASLLSANGANVWAVDMEIPKDTSNSFLFIKGMWPDIIAQSEIVLPRMDLVIFARSLQLMSELDSALDAVENVIDDDSCLCVESFAFVDTNETTIRWVVKYIQQLEKFGLAEHSRHPFYKNMLSQCDVPDKQAWMQNSTCFSHTVSTIKCALEDRYAIVEEKKIPFFFRHFAPMLLNADTSDVLMKCYRDELLAISNRDIQAIGRHWWCTGLNG